MMGLPNLLSLLRILLIPVYLYYFLAGNYITAAIIFSFSALTDFLDGYFARKYQLTSDLGRILDPTADKLSIISILIALIISDIIPHYIPVILLIRELFIFISSGITYLLGYDMINPSLLGKISIFLLYLAIALRLLNIKFIGLFLFYLVIPLNIVSGLDYIKTTLNKLSSKVN
ncbi:MAG: CDP-alcohol phosphatidyltransferase family protein [Firmicutes bacterium]|nr:CDP-alcohol phosphatidyltransferase family protein [Bacillota bacterium]